MDPEALIKCTTIIPGGVASSTPGALEKVLLGAGDEAMSMRMFNVLNDWWNRTELMTMINLLLS